MRRRQFLTTATGLAAATTGLPAVTAQESDEEAPVNPNAYLTNEQLERRLALLDQSDLITVSQIGESAGLGAPVWEVQLGEGDTNVHLITQIHGDEPAGTDGILVALRQMTAEPDRYEDVLDELSITIVPRMNPDGAMYGEDLDGDDDLERLTRRQNTQPWERGDSRHEPYYHYGSEGQPSGYDMNRDFNLRSDLDRFRDDDGFLPADWWSGSEGDGETSWQLDMPYEGHTLSASGLRLTPEVRAVTRSFLRADPDYAITHHHQGIPTDPGSEPPEPSIMSVMAAFGPSYLDQAPFYDGEGPVADAVNPFIDRETSERSLRLNRLVHDRLAEVTDPWDDFDTVTRYGYATLWGSYLDALCPRTNAAGMLYEISGQSSSVGSRAYGQKVEASRVGFLETFEALADDPQLSSVDAESYFDIPLSGEEFPIDEVPGEGGETVVPYQVDFVVGEPNETLGESDDDFYGRQERLIQYVNGDADGVTTRDTWINSLPSEIRDCVSSDPIAVSDGTASVAFTVAEGCELQLSLVSYTLPGGEFSFDTADEQELVDAATTTVGSGEYTLDVTLPTGTAEGAAADRGVAPARGVSPVRDEPSARGRTSPRGGSSLRRL
ncbi:M14 family zinc carboxypeptidase [Candidatus Halobonum tyrrellensis]|uniref:Carboxypeptidase n=1 Tax=Candidatus Halobonum tyrrellensis G22 TaxID=1324957 RepID=V4GW23_9EURY|nr:M14 family zinc carboxypeptidase [Candidatus Halobonum tyrrellensis]ESP89331.1 carboxypeptidase [Candidatus Halobonum tyrrellensis G22]